MLPSARNAVPLAERSPWKLRYTGRALRIKVTGFVRPGARLPDIANSLLTYSVIAPHRRSVGRPVAKK